MASPFKPEDLQRLKGFIEACKKSPHLLNVPQLDFFREYVESLGGKIPPAAESEASLPPEPEAASEPPKEEEPASPEEESEESEVELDTSGLIEAETVDPPPLGDANKMVSEDDEVAASEKRGEAMVAIGEGDLDTGVSLFTEAIVLNPGSAILYAKRASILLKQKRINAAVRDCDEAVKLNPDCAAAYKYRGRAHRFLGNWLEAARDLRMANKLDCDEETIDWLKEVQPNATKLEEHQRKYERMRQEKEIRERCERVRKAQEEAKKAQETQQKESKSFPQGGMGGMPPNFAEIFSDPDIMAAMRDPEVAAAFQDVSSNPANILKYQNNPKVSSVINKLAAKFGGGMPTGMDGMPGNTGGCCGTGASKPCSSDDLD